MSEDRMPKSDLRAISKVLGNTDEGLTDKEITEILDICGVKDEFTDETKWQRLFKSLSKQQSRDGHRGAILAFIREAMNPERYVGEPDKFERRRIRLNEELALCGLEAQGDGTVTSSEGMRQARSEGLIKGLEAQSDGTVKGLIRALWRGHVPLVETYWLYGVVGTLILNTPYIAEDSYSDADEMTMITAVFFLIYSWFGIGYIIFICVSIWRSAGNYMGPVVWVALARVAVVINLALIVLGIASAI